MIMPRLIVNYWKLRYIWLLNSLSILFIFAGIYNTFTIVKLYNLEIPKIEIIEENNITEDKKFQLESKLFGATQCNLTGILDNKALINNQWYSIGEEKDGIKLIAILFAAVKIKVNGIEQILKMDFLNER